MKKNEIKSAVDALTTTAEVIAFAKANNLAVVIDATADVVTARNAVIAVGEDDAADATDAVGEDDAAPLFDFGAMMQQFDAEAAVAETPKERNARIIKEVLAVELSNGIKPNRLIEGIHCAGSVTVEKREGYWSIGISCDKLVPTIGENGIIGIRTIRVSLISILSSLKLAGHGSVCQWIADYPYAVTNILTDAKFDVLTQFTAQQEYYRNPFSTSDRELVARTNRIDHHMVNLELGPKGLAEVKAISDEQRTRAL